MRVAARYRRQHAVSGGDAVTAGFNRQLDDVLRIEIQRVGGERGGGGVLDALIDRQDRQVAGAGRRPWLNRVCIERSTLLGRLLSIITRSTKSAPGR